MDNQSEQTNQGSLWEDPLVIGFLASFVPSFVPGLYWFFIGQTGGSLAFLFSIGGIPGAMIGSAIGNAINKQNKVVKWIGAIVGACLGSYLLSGALALA